MKQRLLKLTVALLVPMTIVAILLAVGSTLSTNVDASSGFDSEQTTLNDPDKPSIVARRLTSIPYTVDSVLPIAAGGQAVQASGPGTCADLGDSFTIRLTVTQDGQQNRAMGVSQGDCATQNGWVVIAIAPGNHTLVPGPAEVCGHAMIQGGPEGTLVGDWCVDVTLQ